MLGIAQSVFIFVFAKFSITVIGQIRTVEVCTFYTCTHPYQCFMVKRFYEIFFPPLFAQLFDKLSYLIMKYFGLSLLNE